MALQRAKAPYDRLLLLLVVAFALAADTAGGAPAGNIARKGAPARPRSHHRSRSGAPVSLYEAASYCLSWRLAVEADNVKEWRTAPSQCWPHIQIYMLGGQYGTDLNFIMQHIVDYVDGIVMAGDGFDAWVLDVDDTCLSNLLYYSHRRFGLHTISGYNFVSRKAGDFLCCLLHSHILRETESEATSAFDTPMVGIPEATF